MSNKNVSAATVTYFSELSMLRMLLASMQQAATELFNHNGLAVEFYLIDNSNNETYFTSLGVLLKEFPAIDGCFRVEILKSPGNIGYGAGNNLILDRLGADYHLIVNPDVVVQNDTLWQAVEYLDENKGVGILSPMIVNERAEVHHVVKAYPDCFTLVLRYLGYQDLNRRFSARLGRYQCAHLIGSAVNSVELAGGCFMFIRTELFQRLQGFDDHFFMYFEDYDLSIRARVTDTIAYVPMVKISHAGGEVGRKKIRHHVFFAVSAIKFFFRHGWRLW